jgi:hypothetical protein
MPEPSRPQEAVYEVTVAGAVGPIVAAALAPCHVAYAEVQTTLGAYVPGDVDVAELLRRLEARGCAIASISTY